VTLYRTSVGIAVALLTSFPVITSAQSAGARDYQNTPVYDTRFFIDLVDTKADTVAESDLALPNNEVVVRTGVLSLLYSFPIGGQYGGVALNEGRAKVEVAGPFGYLQTSGLTDPGLTFHVNFFGAPALRRDQFLSAIPQTFLSFHLTTNAPLGSYDRNSPVNVGANRWAFTPLLNLSITRDEGVSWVDVYAGVRFFTNNNAFLGNNQLSQNPLGTLTVHYSHNIGKMWASIGVFYDKGGETYVNNVPQHDTARGFRPSAAISRAFGKFRLTLRLDDTASTPGASPTNRALSLKIAGPVPPF
jgi:outer membrane putative beta-barrel porin/alpha-amylase